MDFGGNQSTHLAFLSSDLAEVNSVEWVVNSANSGLTDNVLITDTAVIPEPMTIVLLGLGLVGLLGCNRRKRS